MYYNIYEGSAPDTQYNKIALHLAMTVAGLFTLATSDRPAAGSKASAILTFRVDSTATAASSTLLFGNAPLS